MRPVLYLLLSVPLFTSSVANADFAVSKKPTRDVSCAGGVCTPTAKNANLNVSELTNMLASGDVTLKSGSGDGTAATIELLAALSWTKGKRLTIDAKNSIIVTAPITVRGPGSLTLNYAEGNPNGVLHFSNKGKVDFWDFRSALYINGANYFLVKSLESLSAAIRHDPSQNYALTKDYDATGDGTYRSPPIKRDFFGNFEGLGHRIDHLTISSGSGCIGLFAETDGSGGGGIISGVAVTNAAVTSTGDTARVGILVGCGRVVKSSYVSGFVRASKGSIGGLVGDVGTMLDSRAEVNVTADSGWVGGLAGDAGPITNSHAAGSVILNGGGNAGGLAGVSSHILNSSAAVAVQSHGENTGGFVGLGGDIYNSSASGSVESYGGYAGGFVGYPTGVMDGDYATGNVVSHAQRTGPSGIRCLTSVGGFSGVVAANREQDFASTVLNSYALGTVTAAAGACAGGMTGAVIGARDTPQPKVANSYSIGTVSEQEPGHAELGGFLGYIKSNKDFVQSGYWDLTTSGLDIGCGSGECSGVTGLTDAELKSGLPKGFDPKIWGSDPNINNGYPYLRANPPQ
ncbi:MAG: hypothetical protein JO056_10155 [Alphaproteobacteria bacterium]|nr:hypothetical protein [Alphaproteobacteria bacterium]